MIPTNPLRGFHWSTRAWYASACHRRDDETDEVTFGHYHPDGGTTGEMTMKWIDLGNRPSPTPQLCVFDDAWAVLATMPDLIAALGKLDNQNISAEAFCTLLKSLGFRDLTAYETPERYRTQDHPVP